MSSSQSPSSISPSSPMYISPFTAPPNANLLKPSSTSVGPKSPRVVPRSPLPPHRLAKLANALGISAPAPASTNSLVSPTLGQSSFTSASSSSSSATVPAAISRSPSPSHATPPSTKYMLHVIPPTHFPYEREDDLDDRATFRRGSLVPLHPTLQTQMSAIAREFGVPSTQGMTLFFVSDISENKQNGGGGVEMIGTGPRIGEEIWKWVWSRVADEQMKAQTSAAEAAALSSPVDPRAPRKFSSPLLGSLQAGQVPAALYPLTPTPSSPSTNSVSSAANIDLTSVNAHPPPTPSTARSIYTYDRRLYSSPSPIPDQDRTATPSVDLDPHLLPGFGSSSFISLLAKIEFDLDRKAGGWYDKWCKARRSTFARQRSASVDGSLRLFELRNEKPPLRALSPAPSLVVGDPQGGYVQLSESPIDSEEDHHTDEVEEVVQEETEEEGEEEEVEEVDVMQAREDPLSDVFGSDGEAWGDIKAERPAHEITGDEVELALDGAALANLPDLDSAEVEEDETVRLQDKVDEVVQLWNDHRQPRLSLDEVERDEMPREETSSAHSTPPRNRQSGVNSTPKKSPPPPLSLNLSKTIQPLNITVSPGVDSATSSTEQGNNTDLPYLPVSSMHDSPSEMSLLSKDVEEGPSTASVSIYSTALEDEEEDLVPRSSVEEKREGQFFDNLDLDLDITVADADDDSDMDMEDIDERRLSQYRFRSQLDELERNIAQLSPRTLQIAPPSTLHNSMGSISLRSAPPGTLEFGSDATLSVNRMNPVTNPPVRSSSRALSSVDIKHGPFITTSQILHARPSTELVEDEPMSPPAFREPNLVGTPSPTMENFRFGGGSGGADRDSKASFRSRSTIDSNGTARDSARAAWPAVPYSAISQPGDSSPVNMSPKLKYSSGVTNSNPNTKSPPRLTLNGSVRSSLKSVPAPPLPPPVFSAAEQSRVSAESQARSLEYVDVVARPRKLYEQQRQQQQQQRGAGRQTPTQSADTSSPVIPLSPDPFGRFSSAELQSPTLETPSSYGPSSGNGLGSFTFPPERSTSLAGAEMGGLHNERRRSSADEDLLPRMSSRFSADSLAIGEEQQQQQQFLQTQQRASRVSVKSISKLWRKNTKSNVGGKVSPEPDSQSQASTSRGPSPSPSLFGAQPQRSGGNGKVPLPRVSTSTTPSNVSPLTTPTAESMSASGYYLDQDGRYPVRRTPSPNQGLSSTTSPPNVNSILGSASSSVVTGQVPPSGVVSGSGVASSSSAGRKSILKWKSSISIGAESGAYNAYGSAASVVSPPASTSAPGHASSPSLVSNSVSPSGVVTPTSAASTSTSSSTTATAISTAPVRKRRPSMLDVAASMIRGHGFGGGASYAVGSDGAPSPAVPEVPAEYRSSVSTSVSAKRRSRSRGVVGLSQSSISVGFEQQQQLQQLQQQQLQGGKRSSKRLSHSTHRKSVPSSTETSTGSSSSPPLQTPISDSPPSSRGRRGSFAASKAHHHPHPSHNRPHQVAVEDPSFGDISDFEIVGSPNTVVGFGSGVRYPSYEAYHGVVTGGRDDD